MNAPALVNITIPSLTMNEAELLRVLESSVYPGAKLDSIKLVVGYCKGQNLDPMLKPVHIVPMNVKKAGTKDQYEWRDVLMPGIGLYRTIAARTGEYAGCTEPEFGPMQDLKIGDFVMKYPEWCKVTVSRLVQGHAVTFTAKEYWLENYATAGRDSTVPNAMWKKRPIGQLAKCAEAQALRKAFPEVGAQPTAEEMEGKTLDPSDALAIEGEVTGRTIEQPKSKSKPEGDSPESRAAGTSASGPTGGGVSPGANTQDKPITPGAIKTIKSQMERASLSTTDLHAKFGHDADGVLIEGWTIERLTMSQVNGVLDWVKNPQGK